MRRLFDDEGTVSRAHAEAAYRRHMIELARLDAEVVRPDIEGTTGWVPTIEISAWEATVVTAAKRQLVNSGVLLVREPASPRRDR